MTGVYKIQSILKPNRIYIGSAKNIKERWLRHTYELNNKKHNNKKLQRHFDKYGDSDLQFTIIIECDISELKNNEQDYMNELSPYFNILKTAYSLLGYKHTKESIEKIKIKNTGRKMTTEQIQRGVISRIGQNTSKGCKRTLKQREHLSNIKKIPIVYNNIIYPSLKELSIFLGVKYQTLYAMITNRNKNKFNIQHYGS